MTNIYTHVRTKAAARKATFKDYIISAIEKAYFMAESEGEANYLSTKFVLQMVKPLNERNTRNQGGGDPYINLNNTLKELAHKLPAEYNFLTDVQVLTIKHAAKRLQEATSRHYMYIFVRQDMIPEQQAVQASHATFVAGAKEAQRSVGGMDVNPATTHFVLIGVPNEDELHIARALATENGIHTHVFYEEDMNNEMTAFATQVVGQNKRAVFKDFGLLKMQREAEYAG